jgi:hypothetical protein
MSILKAVVHWSAFWQHRYKIPKGYLLLRYAPRYRKNVAAALSKLDEYQKSKLPENYTQQEWEDALRTIDMTLDIHYKKRSLDQNALMWSLYEIEANELNGYRKSADMETAEHIYEMDMKTFAPRLQLRIPEEKLEYLKRTYSMVEILTSTHGGDVEAMVYVTSSLWNSKEMHDHLEMIFDRLSMAGVDLKATADISHYWMEWQAALNEQKVILHDDLYTVDEYKDLVKNCEACGCAVWHDDVGSSAAHIKAVGMGGGRVNKYHGSELMHLCDTDHAKYDNGKGRDKFLEEFPHLTYKVSTALRRDYGQEEDHGDNLDIF